MATPEPVRRGARGELTAKLSATGSLSDSPKFDCPLVAGKMIERKARSEACCRKLPGTAKVVLAADPCKRDESSELHSPCSTLGSWTGQTSVFQRRE